MTPDAEERPARTVDWRRVLVESVAVVLSILLAFAIDAWWDGRLARNREALVLRGILADYRASRPSLEARLDLARRMARNNTLIVDLLTGASASARPLSVPDSLILAVLGGPTYEPDTNTLDAAIGSGEIELIRSVEIRRELANWRRTLVDMTEDELEVRRLTNQQVVPGLARTIDLGPYYAKVLEWTFEPPVSGLPGHVTLRPSTEVTGALAVRRFYQQFAAEDLAALLASLDRAVALIEAELGP